MRTPSIDTGREHIRVVARVCRAWNRKGRNRTSQKAAAGSQHTAEVRTQQLVNYFQTNYSSFLGGSLPQTVRNGNAEF